MRARPWQRGLAAAGLAAWGGAAGLSAHPTPYSYADLRLVGGHVTLSVSAHAIDAGHEVDERRAPGASAGNPTLAEMGDLGRELLARLELRLDGQPVACETLSGPATDGDAVRWLYSCPHDHAPQTVDVAGPLFPYDPEHQTFVNLYVDAALKGQGTLDREHRAVSFAIGSSSQRLVTFRRFATAGVEHILAGPDHLLFLAGLLLTGRRIARLAAIVTTFTVAHSVTLGLSVLDVVTPPPRLIEPLIALSIVYVGLRNLSPARGADWRLVSAGVFGLIHGFGFAYALREMQLPRPELALSLFSFNLGVETGQIAVVVPIVLLLTFVRRLSVVSERQVVVCGAVVVTGAGAAWFVERMMLLFR